MPSLPPIGIAKYIHFKTPIPRRSQRTFIPNLVEYFLELLRTIHPGSAEREAVTYCERFVEFIPKPQGPVPPSSVLCPGPPRRG